MKKYYVVNSHLKIKSYPIDTYNSKVLRSYPVFMDLGEAETYINNIKNTVIQELKEKQQQSKQKQKGPRICKSPTAMTHEQFNRLKKFVGQK